ncbi:MAG: hypothetical protein ACOC5T_01710 [Elusimicrobiota bacterium]
MIKFAMVFDNCMWMPADRKWYHTKQWKKHFKPLFLIGKREYFLIPKNKEGCKIIMSRIKEVLTHIYDIIPAIISATILSTIKLITGF